MRNASIILAVTVLAGVMIVNLNDAGLPQAFGDDIQVSMPNEAVGFSGTLSGVSAKPSGNGWCTIKVVKVLSFDAKNRVKLSVDALTAVWKDKYVAVGPADPKNGPPLPEMNVGDGVIVAAHQNEMHLRYTQVIAFKPGEDEPNCYVFVKKVEKGNGVSVTLRKMRKEQTVTLAMEKGADDKMVPRADLLAAVNGLEENSVVMVQLDHNVLKSIKAYEPPRKGEFVKVTTRKLDEKVLPAVEIKDDSGAAQTLPLSAGNSADLARAARNLKAGTAILYRTESDDKGVWLTEIRPAS